MLQKVISKQTENSLEILKESDILKNFYLAGGTGLALQIKHRLSLDLDFFSKEKLNPEILIQKLKSSGQFSIQKKDENTLVGVFNKTNISFFTYDYPVLFPFKKIKGIFVADIRDIGCMKISAISSRGAKKDFIDVYFICQVVSLKRLLDLFKKKYKSVDYNMLHILKSLVYFDDAQKEPMPKMIKQVSWQTVREFFIREVRELLKGSALKM